MSSYWVDFATTGDPNGLELATWTVYDLNTEPYLEFGDMVQIQNHCRSQLDFVERRQAPQ